MSAKEEADPEASTELENPFQKKHGLSDVALVVEGRKLHVHRTLLALHSPVFERMFFSEFVEKDSPEIELPGKKYDDFVQFLLQLYPVHSLQPITDDKLPAVLILADEYQAEHVLCKCHDYIKNQIANYQHVWNLSTNQLLLYLWMCHETRFQVEKDKLVDHVKGRSFRDISTSEFYDRVDARLMRDVLCAKGVDREKSGR